MRPLVPVLLSFAAGIIAAKYIFLSYQLIFVLLALSLLPAISLFLVRQRFNALVITVPFFMLGALFITPHLNPELPSNHIKNIIREIPFENSIGTGIEGFVTGSPEAGSKRTRICIEARRINYNGQWKDVEGKVLLSIYGNTDAGRGDYIGALANLREPRNFGNRGEFDYKGRLNLQGIFATGSVKNERLIYTIKKAEPDFMGRIDGVRDSISAFIDNSDIENKGALKALIIAEEGGIGKGLRETFKRTGTWHIISISGLHVGIVAVFSYTIFLFLLKRSEYLALRYNIKKLSTILSLAPVVFYGLLAGFPVPTQRAVIMVAAFVIAFAMNRGKDFYNTLAFAALIILLLYPYSIWDVSFQLTFAAMFSIVYIESRLKNLIKQKKEDGRPEKNHIKKLFLKRVLPTLLVTIAAGIGISPIVAYHFNQISLMGLAANLIAIPLTGVIVPLLFISVLLIPLWAWLASSVLFLADMLFRLLAYIISIFSALPYAAKWVPSPAIIEIILFYAIVICLLNFRKNRIYAYSTPVIAAGFVLNWGYFNFSGMNKNGLKVTFLSVGQGESEFIEFPDGKTMLIDGGGIFNSDYDIGEKVIAPFLWSARIDRVDYMVLTHAQLDHMGGLKFIAENFDVGEFWWNGEGGLDDLGGAISGKVKTRILDSSTQAIKIGGADVRVINPPHYERLRDENNNSLVLKVAYGDKSFLFTGDIGKEAESSLLYKNISSSVLKAPHHGSRYSSDMEFLQKVRPSVVVVSAGFRNIFNFPHKETLERYRSIGAKVFRTDEHGAVTIETDGKNLRVEPYLTAEAL